MCLFSHGQSGSGKTYTMQGKENDAERGIIPRIFQQLAEHQQHNAQHGWTYDKMKLSCLEIHNETIIDLLLRKENSSAVQQYFILENGDVQNLTTIKFDPTDNSDGGSKNLHEALNGRSVASTNINSESSRSHMVIWLRFSATNKQENKKLEGELKLVDLAGSESSKRSGVKGDDARDAGAINSSLVFLGQMIRAKKTKEFFSDSQSKLTQILSPSFSPNTSKLIMIVNLSPTEESAEILKLANDLQTCVLGEARCNITTIQNDSSASQIVTRSQTKKSKRN